MIYECTDCRNCASFSAGFRVFCLHKSLSSAAVVDYYPVGDGDARNCNGFDEGEPHEFSYEALVEAEKSNPEVTYESIRKWCENKLRI